ncbi:MAG: TonB-dependent receptor, partial [Desulfobacterales bacterium]
MTPQIQCRPRLLFLLVCFSIAGIVYAQDTEPTPSPAEEGQRFELQEIVVTATRIEEEIRNVDRHVTVITSADIEQATSNNVVDLLAREADVNLRSFFGTDKQGGVDIRGMGQSSTSNVLVMVDGFRLNPPDLAGPDFSSIPLDEIERIEVLRGAGSVVYGSGAVGGVINIITKRGKKAPSARLFASYGSYDTYDVRASGSGQVKNCDVSLNADYYDTDGYRDNGFLRKKDIGIRSGYDLSGEFGGDFLDAVLLSLAASYHDDDQGFPGGVSI